MNITKNIKLTGQQFLILLKDSRNAMPQNHSAVASDKFVKVGKFAIICWYMFMC